MIVRFIKMENTMGKNEVFREQRNRKFLFHDHRISIWEDRKF